MLKILVMGAGAVGSYYGAKLAQASHKVTFVARGAHLQALQGQGGVRLSERQGEHFIPLRAAADPVEAAGQGRPFDLVLFTVKTYDTQATAAALKPILRPQTMVLTIQNGLRSPSQ